MWKSRLTFDLDIQWPRDHAHTLYVIMQHNCMGINKKSRSDRRQQACCCVLSTHRTSDHQPRSYSWIHWLELPAVLWLGHPLNSRSYLSGASVLPLPAGDHWHRRGDACNSYTTAKVSFSFHDHDIILNTTPPNPPNPPPKLQVGVAVCVRECVCVCVALYARHLCNHNSPERERDCGDITCIQQLFVNSESRIWPLAFDLVSSLNPAWNLVTSLCILWNIILNLTMVGDVGNCNVCIARLISPPHNN